MLNLETTLSKQEKKWILERRVSRLFDNKEVQIYPMGAERYLFSILFGDKNSRYNIRSDIVGKNVLVIPGYATSSFLFALSGAASVTAIDKDPVTIAWMKSFKKYYYYRENEDEKNPSVGEILAALTRWYPPLIPLTSGKITNFLFWIIHPNLLRRKYIHYLVFLVQQALASNKKKIFELQKNIQFHASTLDNLTPQKFDTAFVPYLLGVENGIETKQEIINFMDHLIKFIPNGRILVTPSKDTKEFYIVGNRYFVTTGYSNILDIPELKKYSLGEDNNWFRTQGLALFGVSKAKS